MITAITAIVAFLFAGRAKFTLVSTATGTRYTYQVTKARGNKTTAPWFVSVLTGSDNEHDYSYMGCIFPDKPHTLRHTAKSRVTAEAPSAKAFAWYLAKLAEASEQAHRVEFWHAGECGRCGRELTDPNSIESGLGPVCAGKVAA